LHRCSTRLGTVAVTAVLCPSALAAVVIVTVELLGAVSGTVSQATASTAVRPRATIAAVDEECDCAHCEYYRNYQSA
jgi:hypothetical protein